jgi:hypothetical protein
MGFNHCQISNLNSVMWELDTFGIEKFVHTYTKVYDAYSGDSDGIQFIEKTLKEYYEQTTTTNKHTD